MGNLYTQIIRRPNDKRIEILLKLKIAYRTYPRDMKTINELKNELEKYQFKTKKINYRKKYGMFAWKAKPIASQHDG